jgi:protein required for attachment to host cells
MLLSIRPVEAPFDAATPLPRILHPGVFPETDENQIGARPRPFFLKRRRDRAWKQNDIRQSFRPGRCLNEPSRKGSLGWRQTVIEGLKIPHDSYVAVCDGRKALFLRNEGDEAHPNLQVEHVAEAPPNPFTRAQGTDRPARVRSGELRNAIEQTDWHGRAEKAFAQEIAAKLNTFCDANPVPAVVVVAPPHTLAHLRDACPDSVKRLFIAEISRDLTRFPVHEIEEYLTRRKFA